MDPPGNRPDAARVGDAATFDDLLARHLGRLVRFAQASMGAGLAATVTAEDIVQEASMVAARKFAEFEPHGPASFYAWLVSIVRYKLAEADPVPKTAARAARLRRPRDPDSSALRQPPAFG